MDSEVTEVVATIIEDDDPAYLGSSGPPSGGCLLIGTGIVLMLVGVPMLVCPGPGIATMILGFGFILRGLGFRPPAR